ncbi:transporter substrate-binding domain-containing protein [Legionella fallonii]|nr:transporter substrate-binding domain-containing protein [Legionella fallonii]
MKNICLIILLCCFCISAQAKIKIGTPKYAPPYSINDPKQGVSGFDIDYMKKACQRLSWDCEFIPMKYIELTDALKENKIDLAIGAMVITQNQQNSIIFSLPYLTSDAGFLVSKNSSIDNVSALQGKKVGALHGKAYIDYLSERFNQQISIVPYEVFTSIAMDLNEGKIDAIFMNYLSALYLKQQFSDRVRVLSEHFQVGDGIGIAAMPANKDKIDQINKAILQFQTDGTFTNLYNYYFQFIIN